MLLARIETLDKNAISYTEDLVAEYSQAIQDVVTGKISYEEFIARTDIIQATHRERALKTIEEKYQDSGFGY